MIDPVTAQDAISGSMRLAPDAALPVVPLPRSTGIEGTRPVPAADEGTSFGDLVGGLVRQVDAKGKAAEAEMRSLMLGESDNIHRAMIAMQEAGVAFTLLLEVRNKLVESYQELMRMPV